jgi:tetratricopeptide (TPR) repeat protein
MMSGLRKPRRISVLAPDLSLVGSDSPYEAEAALLLWSALIDILQRHPLLAVYDPESTPLFPQDGHFVPQHAVVGATPTDVFYATTRRDELIWLELQMPKTNVVRLHAVARDGQRESFEALGRNVGEQIQQLLGAWLTARNLPAMPKRFDPVTAEDLLAAVRVFAPTLVEHARLWTADASSQIANIDDIDEAPSAPAVAVRPKRRAARPVANRLAQVLRVPTLRLLELALHEDLSDLILALDADHPQALFATYLTARARGKDFALLRRTIAAAPCWARPLGELVDDDEDEEAPLEPTMLETVAAAGIAALCRPAQLDVIERVADHLRDDGRADEALRLMERAMVLHHDDSRAHISLLELHRATERIGAWLEQAHRSGRVHGCPMDPRLPWYPDQIQIDLLVADALMSCGRLDEAIALRANRLEGREGTWPRHARILATWRKDPRFVAWCYAREGFFRGDPARAVEGFGRIEPDDSLDLAIFLESLVAMGREEDVLLAWAQFGLGRGFDGALARLAAARCLMITGEWRRGIEELWRVQLTEPGRDDLAAISRCGLLMSVMPIDVAETALAERMAVGASTLARRMARDVADFVPAAAKSSIVLRALGKLSPTDIDASALAKFPIESGARKAIDAVFAELASDADPLAISDRLVNRWFDAVFDQASDNSAMLANAGAYVAAQALARYLSITTRAPTPIAGGLRMVAGEALSLVARHRHALSDRAVQALLGAIEPLLRRADRWIGTAWLATVERCCGIDERAAGDVPGFVRDYATVAARILGPEEAAVLSASVARLHRDRPDGWDAAVGAQAGRLALHTGYAGVDEWADATVAQHAARTIDLDDAVDTLHTAAYLAEGVSAMPSAHLARVLFGAGRAPAGLHVLCAGLAIADTKVRDRELAALAPMWNAASPGVPMEFDKVATGMFEALQKGEAARAEKLGRWAVALDPTNGEAHRNLGLALAQQGKLADALHHLVRGTPEQATQILAGVLYQSGKLVEAMTVLDYASRWYVRADQWLTYGGIAYAAMDNPRTVKAYALAYQLDPDAFDTSQLNAFAGVLDEVGDYVLCEKIANHLLRVAEDDILWKTNAWNHLACAYIGLGRFDEAVQFAEQAVTQNPLADNTAGFAATLERARTKTKTTPPPPTVPVKVREPVFALLEAGDFASASVLGDAGSSWRTRRAALCASRFRFASENDVEVTPRARAAANAALVDTVGLVDLEAVIARMVALEVREQAYFARDPLPRLGDRMTRDAFYREFRARGGIVLGEDAPPPPKFVDVVVVPGSKVARVSDYVALLRDLAALTPREALAQFDLDDAGYIEVAKAWGAAIDRDPSLARTIAAGLAKR